jgi:hypothetical protein
LGDERAELLKGLGRNLDHHMEALGVTAEELAERTEFPKDRIDRIVKADVEAGAIEAVWIAGAPGIFTDELLAGTGESWGGDEGGGALLTAYAGGRREGARPVEDLVREPLGSRLQRCRSRDRAGRRGALAHPTAGAAAPSLRHRPRRGPPEASGLGPGRNGGEASARILTPPTTKPTGRPLVPRPAGRRPRRERSDVR